MSSTVDFVTSYVRRVVDDELDELFEQLPAVLLDGAKGVGKTTTALRRCQTVRRLDDEAQRQVVAADPNIIRDDPSPVLIDEWHRVPAVFDAVRRLVDAEPTGGRFLLTGSPPTRQTHSGAGRITSIRMRTLTLFERRVHPVSVSLRKLLEGQATVSGQCALRLSDYVDEIVAGGYPGLRHLTDRALTRQLDSYIERIVDHDLPELGYAVRQPETVRRWLAAYAAATATTASWEKIRNAASPGSDDKPAKTTTQPYVELLTALRILDPIDATNNQLKTLTVAPKHHLVDPALAARLVRLSAAQLKKGEGPQRDLPRDGSFLGGLFESLAALSVRTFAQLSDARVYHLRTWGGRHEVDLLVETSRGVVAFEVKLGTTVEAADVKHLQWLRDKIGDECLDVVVLNTGPEAYRRKDGVGVVPLGLLGP